VVHPLDVAFGGSGSVREGRAKDVAVATVLALEVAGTVFKKLVAMSVGADIWVV